jgi:hypothetical protein
LRQEQLGRDASSSRRHEGTTIKRCHFNLPDFLKLGSDRAKCKARRASTGNATTLAEYRKAPCNYLNDKERGQGPRFASISLERHGCISVRFTGKMPDMRENSATFARQPIVELTLGRRETACGSAGRHADPAFDEGT